MNKRQRKKRYERHKKSIMYLMVYNRAHIEWAYAKHLPIFKSLRNYQKAVKYRLHQHMKTGNTSLLYYHRNEPVKNYAYLRDSLLSWVEPRQMELSAKHLLIKRVNPLDEYYARYNLIMGWKQMEYIRDACKRLIDLRESKALDEIWGIPT